MRRNRGIVQSWFLASYFSTFFSMLNIAKLSKQIEVLIRRLNVQIHDLTLMATHSAGNSCRNLGSNGPNYMQPIQAGQLLTLMTPSSLPPALSPIPPLTLSDVTEPPLPSASRSVAPGSSPSSLNPSSGQRNVVSLFVSLLMASGFLLL